MSEIKSLNDLPVLLAADCNGVRLEFEAGSNYKASQFFIKAASSNPTLWSNREISYIQAIENIESGTDENGYPIRKVAVKDGRFAVIPQKFFEQIISSFQLKRSGSKWKSDNLVIDAEFVQQKVQEALLPFGFKANEIKSLYNQLRTYCFNSKTIVEPFKFLDLSKSYPKPAFIIEKFMCPGLILFAAPSKTGKSFLSLDLACCVAEGKPFWGFKTDGGAVCYLDLEGNGWRTQERLANIGWKNAPKNLFITNEALNTDEGLLQQIEWWTNQAENPKLLIIDTLELVKGKSAKNETSYSSDYRIMKPLHDMAIAKNIAILAITHTRKGTGYEVDDVYDQIIGSTAQMGASDATWIITGKRNDSKRKFTATGRDFESVEFEIERGAGGKWIFNGTVEGLQEERARAAYHSDPAIKVIKKQMNGSGGTWRTTAQNLIEEIAKETGDYPTMIANKMSSHLRELAPLLLSEDGIILRCPDKNGGSKGRFFTFEQRSLTE